MNEFYFNQGRLDLSILDEEIEQEDDYIMITEENSLKEGFVAEEDLLIGGEDDFVMEEDLLIGEEKEFVDNKDYNQLYEPILSNIDIQFMTQEPQHDISVTLEEIAMMFETEPEVELELQAEDVLDVEELQEVVYAENELQSDIMKNTGIEQLDSFEDAFDIERLKEEIQEFHMDEGSIIDFDELQIDGDPLTILNEQIASTVQKNEGIQFQLDESDSGDTHHDIPDDIPEFQKQQFRYLKGKKLTADMYLETGEILAKKDEIITVSLLKEALKTAKLMHIILNHE